MESSQASPGSAESTGRPAGVNATKRQAAFGPPGDGKQKPGRFALRELFVLTALVGAFLASWSWAPRLQGLGILIVPVGFAFVISYLLYLATRSWVSGVVAVVVLAFGCALLLPMHGFNPEPSRRMQCNHQLKNIALALQSYHDVHGSFPPAYIADANGRPMHSWRVLILPFLGQKPLYDRYDFREPWDGPNNRKLHGEIVREYCCPSRLNTEPHTDTSYVAIVGSQSMWPGEKAMKRDDLTDGTSNTLMVVETAYSGIHWMEPRDLHLGQMPLKVNALRGQGISSDHPRLALGAFADGHPQAMTDSMPPQMLRALITAAGGETISDY